MQNNDKARGDSAEKEAQGLKQYEDRTGVKVTTTQQVRATMAGATKKRVYDGLVTESDGTWGIESRAASRRTTPRKDLIGRCRTTIPRTPH